MTISLKDSDVSNATLKSADVKGLHVLKFISIIMVVGLHTRMPFDHNLLVQFCRVGVPIFFMISGYFTIKPDSQQTEMGLLKGIRKIAKISFIANIVYLSWYLLWDGIAGLITVDYVVRKAVEFMENYLFWGDRYGGHLWYLTSFMHVLVIYWILSKLKIASLIWIVVPVGLLLNLINGRYCGLIYGLDYEPGFYDSRNVFTVGLPFFIIGGWIRKYDLRFNKKWLGYGFILILLSIQCFEYNFLNGYGIRPTLGDINIATIPLSIALFCVGKDWQIKTFVANKVMLCGKLYTMHIYTWHLLVYFVYRTLTSYLPSVNSVPSFLFVYGLSLILGYSLCNSKAWQMKMKSYCQNKLAGKLRLSYFR